MDNISTKVNVIGAGLAGCEAAWQIAKRGIGVRLYEMKPKKFTPAHHYKGFAELVCSNSLRSSQTTNAVGLLKEELRLFGSLIMEAADATAVPAGAALAVDRYKFSDYITSKITENPLIEVIEDEITSLPDDGVTVVATGPLTSNAFSCYIGKMLGEEYLNFFDAAAPIVDASTIDMSKAFFASRYGKGEASYINCPMNEAEYKAFYRELVNAKEAQLKDFDKDEQKNLKVFEGCMPVEVMAKRGEDTLRFGPLKPVGLPDPKTGNEYYAVLQLRQENEQKTMYNLVGFQTHLTFDEQKRVFSMIPGLENASFLRYGVMHRNTYINSPKLLNADYSTRTNEKLFFAGQMTGVEGYIESTSSGWLAGVNAANRVQGKAPLFLSDISATGSLACYVSNPNVVNFQPMNANFGLIRLLEKKVKGGKAAKNEALSERALEYIRSIKDSI